MAEKLVEIIGKGGLEFVAESEVEACLARGYRLFKSSTKETPTTTKKKVFSKKPVEESKDED
jgi:hypothetical protein